MFIHFGPILPSEHTIGSDILLLLKNIVKKSQRSESIILNEHEQGSRKARKSLDAEKARCVNVSTWETTAD